VLQIVNIVIDLRRFTKSCSVCGDMIVMVVCTCSSDDDLDVVLHNVSEDRCRFKRQVLREESSSEDEFEKEMASELNAKMKEIEKRWSTYVTVCHIIEFTVFCLHTFC